MTSIAFPERIAQARELAGLSKTELAQELNVSVAAVSQWEDGSKNPTPDNLVSISKKLGVQVGLLMKPMPNEVLARRGPITFRAQSAAKTAQLRRQSYRLAEMVSELFLWMDKWVTFPKVELPRITDSDVEKAARICRRTWNLGDLPIAKLGELLESKGIMLCGAEFGDVRFDAYSCIIGGKPFAFLGTEKKDRARSRFDAAHELGHLLMHQHLSDEEIQKNSKEIEKQANQFAGAFLMPAETFARDVVDTSIEGFKRLKPKWGIAIQAMVYRARTLGLITEETYERHFRAMSTYGWRRARGEPLDDTIPLVNRSVAKNSLALLETNTVVNIWQIISEMPFPSAVFKSVFEKDLQYSTRNQVLLAKEFTKPNDDESNLN